jgi:hypothetical protein
MVVMGPSVPKQQPLARLFASGGRQGLPGLAALAPPTALFRR